MRKIASLLEELRVLAEGEEKPKTYRLPPPRTIGGLPPKVSAAFWALGDDQRGEPEEAMNQAQEALGGGPLSYAIEHVGDLTNRMTKADIHGGGGPAYVKSKTSFVDSYSGSFGFGNQVAVNAKNNAAYHKVPLVDFWAKAESALKRYADAHAKLTVYNEAQWHAREAAVSLGRMNWSAAFKHIEALRSHLGDDKKWRDYAMQYTLGPDGEPLPHRRSMTEADHKIVSPDAFLTNKKTGLYLWTPERVKAAWAETLKMLDFYLKKPEYTTLVLLVGPPASGKSTWVKQNSKPNTVYFDAMLAQARDRAPLIAKAKSAGKRVEAAVMTTPQEVCIARNKQRTPDRRVPDDIVVKKCGQHEADLPKESEGFDKITMVPHKDTR